MKGKTMNDYMQTVATVATVATVTNAEGDAVEVSGPTVSNVGDMTSAWKSGYRSVMLDIASEAGLVIHNKGMRVTYRIA